MKRLAPDIENALLSILRQVNPALDDRQARRDFAAIVDLALSRDAVPSGQTSSRAAGSHRKQDRLYILAYVAGEFYWAHTGNGPGNANNVESKISGGRYPRFIKLLADAMGLIDKATGQPYTLKKVGSACKRARAALNAEAGLGMLPVIEKDDPADLRFGIEKKRKDREAERLKILAPHVVGYEDAEDKPVSEADPDSFAIMGGYQPAPDFELPAAVRFKGAIEKLKKT